MVAGNMLVTFYPNDMGHAETEIRSRLRDVGVRAERIRPAGVDGVLELLVAGDPKKAVRDLRKLCLEDPGLFLYSRHWVPIEEWVGPELEQMMRVTAAYGNQIGRNERWMLHLHKRHSDEHSSDLIDKLTEPIDKGVIDLKNPQKVIVVELMGDRAGMSLVSCEELLDVSKVKGMIEVRMR